MADRAKGWRVAFISTRISGSDGVSLEIGKWATVLERMGVECFYITGESDRAADRTALIEEVHFNHPEILEISQQAFHTEIRSEHLTNEIKRLTRVIRDRLNQAIRDFCIDGIIPENALTIPMNIPLGIAIVESLQEMAIGCMAHHHDFYWERDRFLVSSVKDLLRYAFPPALPQIQHVVINSLQEEEFSRRTGLSCRIIPNVMDFANPPPAADDYALQFRSQIGLQQDDLMILQPTRVVARKGIEHAIELVGRLGLSHAKLVISHESGDEGDLYLERILDYAKMLNVEIIMAGPWISRHRQRDSAGRPQFTLSDLLAQADLVTYPSEYEGFGNAFLEAIYHRRPVVCNRYLIYRTDIEPCGFKTITFDGFLSHDTIAETKRVLQDASYRQEMVDHNYRIAHKYFSYEVLEAELRLIIERPQNIYRLLGRGMGRNEV
jgi:glycosyltransferase involved in cell wall biosynthesis